MCTTRPRFAFSRRSACVGKPCSASTGAPRIAGGIATCTFCRAPSGKPHIERAACRVRPACLVVLAGRSPARAPASRRASAPPRSASPHCGSSASVSRQAEDERDDGSGDQHGLHGAPRSRLTRLARVTGRHAHQSFLAGARHQPSVAGKDTASGKGAGARGARAVRRIQEPVVHAHSAMEPHGMIDARDRQLGLQRARCHARSSPCRANRSPTRRRAGSDARHHHPAARRRRETRGFCAARRRRQR